MIMNADGNLTSSKNQVKQQGYPQRPQHRPFTAEERLHAGDEYRSFLEGKDDQPLQPFHPEYLFQIDRYYCSTNINLLGIF